MITLDDKGEGGPDGAQNWSCNTWTAPYIEFDTDLSHTNVGFSTTYHPYMCEYQMSAPQ